MWLTAALAAGALIAVMLVTLSAGDTDGETSVASDVPTTSEATTGVAATQPEEPALPSASNASTTPAEGAAPPADGSGLSSGIGVHGRWTISILDPDGALVRRVEFDNALNNDGQIFLATVLARETELVFWLVELLSATSEPDPCLDGQCGIQEPADGAAGAEGHDLLLTLTAPEVLTLTGSVIADQDGEVNLVSTVIRSTTGTALFTSTDITPEPVTAGQQIQVSVEFTFGTLP